MRGGVSRMTEARLGRTTLFLPATEGEEDDTELIDGRRRLIDELDEDGLVDGLSARSWILCNDDKPAYELTLDTSTLFVDCDERREDMGTVKVMYRRAGDFALAI